MIRLPDGPYQRRARRPRRTPRLDGGRAVRALLAFALAFGSVTAVAGAEYGAFAAMGCYLDAYGTRDPRPRRALLTALLGGGFVLAFFAGSLAAGHTWAMVGVLSLVTAAATLFVDTLRLSGPGGYFVLLVAALAAFPAPRRPHRGRAPLGPGRPRSRLRLAVRLRRRTLAPEPAGTAGGRRRAGGGRGLRPRGGRGRARPAREHARRCPS
ncbi:hypothetical protein GA0115236_15241, partial [Streptomyces sp. IgraMP-1]